MITLVNTFHNTETRLRAAPDETLSTAQVRRAWQALCGVPGCTCSGAGGVRGGEYVIVPRSPACVRPFAVERRA